VGVISQCPSGERGVPSAGKGAGSFCPATAEVKREPLIRASSPRSSKPSGAIETAGPVPRPVQLAGRAAKRRVVNGGNRPCCASLTLSSSSERSQAWLVPVTRSPFAAANSSGQVATPPWWEHVP